MKHIFVDGSYFIFYRFFATLNWFKHQKDIAIDDVMTNNIFMEKYEKMFEKTLKDIVRIYDVDWKHLYFAKDCPRDEIWRHKYIKDYKATRVTHGSFDGRIFTYSYDTLIPQLIDKYSFQILQGECLEADDVIALKISIMDKSDDTYIITNDNDYIQLLNCEKLHIINLQHQDISLRNNCEDAKQFLHVKIIQGDKCDNIPSIGPKIGPKTALKLASNESDLLNYFKKHKDAEAQYILNRKLIDFNYIDETYKEKFLKS